MTKKKTSPKEKKKEEVREKAFFLQRLLAFLIDVVLVAMAASIIIFPFTDNDAIQKLTTQSSEIANQYLDQKIDMNTYMNQSMDISYEIAKQNGLSTIITIAVYLLYFVVFQFYYCGQTLGKKLMKIQIIKNNSGELSMNQLLIRSLIINFILVDIIILLFTIFGSKDLYIGGLYIFESIQYLVVFVSAIMAMYRQDGRGLHDLAAGTRVVRCEVKERSLEVCEN